MLVWLLACSPDTVALVVPAEHAALFAPWADVDPDRISVSTEAGGGRAIRLTLDPTLPPEAYAITVDHGIDVRASDALGLQYGAADALERLGYRFWHPYRTFVPERLSAWVPADELHSPQIARRGLHLHTLHPIEGTAALWMPNETNEAEAIFDWVIRSRGDHVQWVALDDIQRDAAAQAAWDAHTTRILDAAHARGLTVGVGVQLFGSGNLQQAWDLVDAPGDAAPAALDARLATLGSANWDVVNLSFGEFFAEEPRAFVDTASAAVARIHARWPDAEVPATIHVGDTPEMRVEWEGQEILYYFLADAVTGATPWVHTVMYYNLYEDAGGAYHHESFDEHRAFLEQKLLVGEPVGYFPETAYWVAFDVSVPQYQPLYVRSRWTDLDGLRRATGQLPPEHVIFESGWEWGYWQNDAAALRMSYEVPDAWEDSFVELFGADHPEMSAAAIALAEAQHRALMAERLAPWIAGRDAAMDLGRGLGIVSQPDRPSYAEIASWSAEERAAWRVPEALEAYADAIAAIPRVAGGPFEAELDDGLVIDEDRARFAAALLRGVRDGDALDAADRLLGHAQGVVDARLAAPIDPDGGRWASASWANPGIYDFGYLARASDLCYWRRERAEVARLRGGDDPVPGCLF